MHTSDSIVIIPTYNEKENIEKIIRAVFGLEKCFHILVIDDGSPDGTAAIVRGMMATEFCDRLFLIERSGNWLGALVVRQDGPEFIEVEMENQKKTRTQDGVHTNEYGARRNGEHLCRVITRMLQDR